MCVEALEKNHICHLCIGEIYLSAEIEKTGSIALCDYCGEEQEPTIPLEQLADRVEAVFEAHYERTPAEPNWYEEQLLKDKESDFSWWREGQPTIDAIEDVTAVSADVARHLQKILNNRHASIDEYWEEAEFDADAHYWDTPADYSDIWEQWREFERELKTETRYFSPHAFGFLKMIFGGLADLTTRDGRPLVVRAGPGHEISEFYRARHFETDEALIQAMKAPDRELAPPPTRFATAGRMNSRGVAAFYGANLPDAALAEVRPPVGSQVLVAKFQLLREVKLLDLSSLPQIGIAGSYFDPDFLPLLKRTKFLGDLAALMSMPVMPNDADLDYLPTQVIADYLSKALDYPLDGILFPSVQTDLKDENDDKKPEFLNVVLFNKSSRVFKVEHSKDTEIDADTWQMYNEGPEREYRVTVRKPPPKEDNEDAASKESSKPLSFADVLGMEDFPIDPDTRPDTLRVDPSSLTVHVVRGVRVIAEPHGVRWFEYNTPSVDAF
ncbi:RES domain-containing protein [Ruegeria sp. HKCCE3926]|uniref:RES domain-containing protein n=1 Tax=Ruegeria sp. HKCCE3926 TaxID=2794831 RepID=UPI001AE266CA|nr:RES domain-containing protein [Ruegeria sp. HKCCE3926]